MNGAQLLIKCLEAQRVTTIFGIPGAKIDAVFDALEDSSIQLVVCRHEQNAAFMAACQGRLTGKPGVVLVTSGPGVANLATGLLTATTEGDPVIAIGGNVGRQMKLKASHQNVDNAKLLDPVTKSSVEVGAVSAIPEAIANAFRLSLQGHKGACFISLPQDISLETTPATPIFPIQERISICASSEDLQSIANRINQTKFPVLLLGEESSTPKNTATIRELLAKTKLATVSTYQAAGVVSRELVDCFAGRVGLFKNQPGDQLLKQASLVITIGVNPVEYDPEIWNADNQIDIIHIHQTMAECRQGYQPSSELLGDIDKNLQGLLPLVNQRDLNPLTQRYHQELMDMVAQQQSDPSQPIHPLRFIHELKQVVTDDTILACDIGSVYMWMARYFLSYQPHQLLFSNGQQTLGVALPWAIATRLLVPQKPIISLSGDGGFLFSAMELETAVRLKQHFIHFIWTDGSYNMVKEQQIMKYKRASGVQLGPINVLDFASSFGAKGYELTDADNFVEIFAEASQQTVPVLINVNIDYRDNPKLFASLDEHAGN